MRIRKRSGPLGLPSISTTHLSHSDPPLSTRKYDEEEEDNKRLQLHPSFGDQHQPSDQVHQTSRTSDLELTFIRGKNGWVCCGDDGDREKKQDEYLCMMNTNIPTSKMEEKELKGLKEEEEEEEEKMIRHGGFGRSTTTKNRKSNSLDGEEEVNNSGYGVPHVLTSNISSDHHQVLPQERWCEGVKGFPLKKRRGSNCERRVLGAEEETRTTMEIKRKQKQIMNTANSNKKWVLHEKDNQELTEEESAKKVEGSRCSRINGRGWRCCQQTLVGYSLCEHHSGKGRLRSMNSIRNRSSTASTTVTKPIKNVDETLVSLEKFEDEEEEDGEEEKTTTIRIEDKKRKKMGMVKARSIRSLLGQTQHDDYVKV